MEKIMFFKLLILALLVGCTGRNQTPEPAVPTTTLPGEQATCSLTAQSDVTVYQRPSTEAAYFGTLAAGETVQATRRTDRGWLGFDPAVAQAANVGVFRLRWVAPDAAVSKVGNCNELPVATAVSPTACYFMAMTDTSVYTTPDDSSAILATIPAGEYTAVIGQSASGWYQLDLQDGSLPQPGTGWLNPADANFNGTCDNLPTVVANPTQSLYSDPFAYCAAVGTIDAPDARYNGPEMPDSIIRGLIDQGVISADAPREFQESAVWRCMNGQVWACHFGANLPCQEKANTSRVPTSEMEEFCKANPAADVIPAAVTGRATVYEWKCDAGRPEVVRQLFQADPQGYLVDFWYELATR